jgi:acetyl esterase
MPLDPEVAAVLRVVNAQPPMRSQPIPALRARRAVLSLPELAQAASAEDLAIPGPASPLPARLYRPAAAAGGLPLLVFFHGGGFVFGSLDSHYDGLCRAICGEARAVVLSVDYRLAPEHPFPAATEDCAMATRHAAAQATAWGADPARLVVAGGSAGGNLAAVTALRLRDEGGPKLAGQLLIYPVVDLPAPTPSYRDFAEGHHLTAADMRWFWEQYLADPADGAHPYAAPLRAASLAGLPPAHLLTAEYDPLRDEGEAYAAALRKAGVAVDLVREQGMIHGFLAFPTQRAQSVVRRAAAWVAGLPPAG